MAVVNGYATLDELKSWINEPLADLDPVLEQQIEAASRWIDGRCQRRFYRDPASESDPAVARVFDAGSCWELRIDDAIEVTGIATDDNADGTFETVWDTADWQAITYAGSVPEARPYRRIRAVGGHRFHLPTRYGRHGLVEVTAHWGWPAIPDAIHQACLLQASRLLKRRNSPEGITGFGSEFGHIRISQRGDPDVEAMLAPYSLAVMVA